MFVYQLGVGEGEASEVVFSSSEKSLGRLNEFACQKPERKGSESVEWKVL